VGAASGEFYVVNGEKKWITNGVFADFFTCAVRTGGPGMGGISLLLVERGPGVDTKQMQCMGVWSSGTSYITFDNVKVTGAKALPQSLPTRKTPRTRTSGDRHAVDYPAPIPRPQVPVGNLIGEENQVWRTCP
jgi:alkylation response protein AidB-like acyl-CoA dehydrogenase